MRGDTLRRGTQPANNKSSEGILRPDQSEHRTSEPLNPFVGWSIALIVSVGLWWALWRAISLLV